MAHSNSATSACSLAPACQPATRRHDVRSRLLGTGASALAIVLTAAAPRPSAEPSIVGTWYEEVEYPDGHITLSVLDIKPDGTYAATFRHCHPTGHRDNFQVGHWTYTGGVFHLTVELGLANIVVAQEDYRTLSLDRYTWSYRLVFTNAPWAINVPRDYRDTRVGPDSKVPDCNGTS